MSHEPPRTSWLAVTIATLAGFGLLLAPADRTDMIRTAIRDAARPGLESLELARRTAVEKFPQRRTSPQTPEAQAAISAERDEWKQRYRRLQSENVFLAGQLANAKSQHQPRLLAESGVPLFIPEMIEASVIGAADLHHAAQRISYRRILDVGQGQDVVPSDFVVNAVPGDHAQPATVIDQGADQGLDADQPVFAGHCIVGKVGQVGRWTSTVIPVTDAAFRGTAQLMRKTSRGLVPGAEGLIAGDGQGGCLMLHVPATEPVAAGDEIYANIQLSGQTIPMYYGQVVGATLAPGASHWTIPVQPAESLESARSVHVLRTVLNAARTHALEQPEAP